MFGDVKGYTLDGIVNLEKRIGKDSSFGTIYLTSMPHILGTFPIASKVMEITQNNESETAMNEWITDTLVANKHSKHFAIMYKSTRCPIPPSAEDDASPVYSRARGRKKAYSPKKQDIKKDNSIDKELEKEERLVDYNELWNGDLNSLMKTEARNDELLTYNIMMQVLIAIATYQNRVGYCHRDCHDGNFLYQLNNEGMDDGIGGIGGIGSGYYHYIYKGFNFYIKSCKYNMCIFDFGESKPMNTVNNETICNDYVKVIYSFMSEDNKGWKKQGWIEDELDKNVNRNMMNISTILQRVSRDNIKNDNLDMFQEVIKRVFTAVGKKTDLYTTKKPAIVLNSIPFVINKVEEYPDITFKHLY
jgi:hypothetical protein